MTKPKKKKKKALWLYLKIIWTPYNCYKTSVGKGGGSGICYMFAKSIKLL